MARTKQGIIDYLGIESECVEEAKSTIERALKIEKEFAVELKNGFYGYGLEGDFDYTPERLEQTEIYKLDEIKRYLENIVLYKVIEKEVIL